MGWAVLFKVTQHSALFQEEDAAGSSKMGNKGSAAEPSFFHSYFCSNLYVTRRGG